MKLGDIVKAWESLGWVRKLALKNGLRAIKLQRIIGDMEKQYNLFIEARNAWMKERKLEKIGPEDARWPELMTWIDEAMEATVKIKVEPIITLKDLEEIEASAADVSGALDLGLIDTNESPAESKAGPKA